MTLRECQERYATERCLNNYSGELDLKKRMKPISIIVLVLLALVLGTVFTINYYVQRVAAQYIVSADNVPQADAILVLGAYVYPNGTVSTMLNDRLTTALSLYEAGKSQRILVSGDHGRKDYDEVNTMKQFLKNKSVPGSVVFMDHAGFNTYNSMYRAKEIFTVKKVIIVTQEYHLKRAVFIARQLGLEAYGVASDKHNYGSVMIQYELREIAARNKDFITSKIIKPKPTFLGKAIPVTGDGKTTDDK
jgi:SanA protein